jgi:hypothetical protein
MNHYVKGEAADPLLTQARAGVTLLRYASELGTNGAGALAATNHASSSGRGRLRRR